METDNSEAKRIRSSASAAAFGIADKCLTTVFPFITRTVIIYILGENWLGLYGLFQSVCQILNITEFGVGEVLVYFMYAPIAEGDTRRVNAFMNEIRRLYHLIGLAVFVMGLCITPFIDRFVTGEIPEGANIHFLFLVYLSFVVFNYFAEPEIRLMFIAHQRGNLDHFLSIIVSIPVYILQLVSLLVFRNFIMFLLCFDLLVLLRIIERKRYRVRYFPDFRAEGQISDEERRDVRKRAFSMIGHQLDTKLLNSVDNVFISSIIGLAAVAVYGNYFCIIVALESFYDIIYGAILPSVGNAITVESRESNLGRFRMIFWISACLTGWGSACLLSMCQNFISIWMRGKFMLDDWVVYLFVAYFYISQIRKTVVTFKNANGMWYNDRMKPYVSIVLDLVLDLILIRAVGVAGAVISSIVSLFFVEMPWETRVLFRDYFHDGILGYVMDMLKYGAVNAIVILSGYYLCNALLPADGVLSLVLRCLLCTLVSCLVYIIFYGRSRRMKTMVRVFRGLVRRNA